MIITYKKIFLFLLTLQAVSCANKQIKTTNVEVAEEVSVLVPVVDEKATYETKALFKNMQALAASNKIMFGHQDATWYGLGNGEGWKLDKDRSDVKSVTGQHPALYGWDLQNIVRVLLGWNNVNKEEPAIIKRLVTEAFDRGGVNTFSWHMQNPVTLKDMYDTTPSVKAIIPGGEKHEYYKSCLDKVADYFLSLRTRNGKLIPVIFRPFHEHNGNWFWWGKPFCTPEEYKQLFQFTVTYLRDVKGVHNLLYAYSTDRIKNWSEYMERYPGNKYVDVVGIDNYWEFKDEASASKAVSSLRMLAKYAAENKKVAALTETGLERISNDKWFTQVLWNNIIKDTVANKLAYIMVWRNAHKEHFYAPYPGHSSVPDFMKFFNDPNTLFQDDLPNMYKVNRNQ